MRVKWYCPECGKSGVSEQKGRTRPELVALNDHEELSPSCDGYLDMEVEYD